MRLTQIILILIALSGCKCFRSFDNSTEIKTEYIPYRDSVITELKTYKSKFTITQIKEIPVGDTILIYDESGKLSLKVWQDKYDSIRNEYNLLAACEPDTIEVQGEVPCETEITTTYTESTNWKLIAFIALLVIVLLVLFSVRR